MNTETEQGFYIDTEGNKLSLIALVRKEPEWAASMIEQLNREREMLWRCVDRMLFMPSTKTIQAAVRNRDLGATCALLGVKEKP